MSQPERSINPVVTYGQAKFTDENGDAKSKLMYDSELESIVMVEL